MLVFSEETLEFKEIGHPESPERVKKAFSYLKSRYDYIEPEIVEDEDLLRVHTREHLERVKNRDFYDPECPQYDNLMHYTRLAAGGAVKAQKIGGFSLMRPPGHHAGRSFLGGFCYFNNLAVAVKKSGLSTLIVDIDGHHGNGTQDIFLGDDKVYFISLHRGVGYPGTGLSSEKNIINFPMKIDCGEEEYLDSLKQGLDMVSDKEIEQIAVSAGFDAHYRDPLASLGLTEKSYMKIGRLLRGLNLAVFGVLEGGYVGDDLGKNIDAFLSGLDLS